MMIEAAGRAGGGVAVGPCEWDEEAGHGLVGRDTELERILRGSGPVQGASPRGLLLLGEEGIGRTRLLRAAREQAGRRGALVLSAHGWAGDRERPYAGVCQLLASIAEEIGVLPELHQQVLGAVVTGTPGPSLPDPPAVQGAVLLLLRHLAADRPVLVTVDDVQDCDRASVDLIGTVLRHLGDGVSVLLAARGEAAPTGLPTEVGVMHLPPLSPGAAAALLDAQPGAPRGRRRLELLGEAQGNPLALLELCRLAQPDVERMLPGNRRPRHPLPRHGVEDVLAALPAGTQGALLHAAIADLGEDVATVTTAAGAQDLGVWAPAEAAGIVTVTDRRVWFRHPLMRRAVGARQPAQSRRAAYLNLAEAAVAPASRARYLAAAALGPDESIAGALEAAARDSQNAFTAAAALEEAARLSPDARDRARRLAEALSAAHLVGDADWVTDLYRDFTRSGGDAGQACVAAAVMSTALSLSSLQQEALDLLLDVSERACPDGGSEALALALVGAAVTDQSARPEHRGHMRALFARTDHEARPPVRGAGPLSRLGTSEAASALHACVSVVATPDSSATRLLRRLDPPRLGPLPDTPDQLVRRLAVAWVAYRADEPDTCLRQYRKADAQLRARQALGLRAWSLAPMADTLLATGLWAEAETLLREGSGDAAVLGQSRVRADLDALTLTLSALRGQAILPSSGTEANWRALDLAENRATHARILRARALAAVVHGDWSSAYREFRMLFDADGSPLHPFLSPISVADLASVALRTGRLADAARVLVQVRDQQGERPTARMTRLLHHAAALLEPDGDPEEHFQLAVVNPEGERWPWERSRARLGYGIWLRRARRPLEAREQFTAALQLAEGLGAVPLAAAVRAELRASGVGAAAEPEGALAELTAQQRQIVTLAAGGLSNREIGERLYLSPRTVGTHLYNIYPKLGVSRRHQLRSLLTEVELGAG
ncbi:Helix-turn-helix transcriptional regulator [Actinacidiphila cocklensis]|uniref:Helix-turn-helix transcriptional regulator n=1 Tax=Actinacidiphila cocklensis TaxID=887465 RepID=A0A9W4DWF6_9ACTN|nr:Helix-turn-helix transcriptional regulator [Actinacidiphila cocklensis]